MAVTAALTSQPEQTRTGSGSPPPQIQTKVIYSNGPADIVIPGETIDDEDIIFEGAHIYIGTNGHRITKGSKVLHEKPIPADAADPQKIRIPQVGTRIVFADGESWIVNRQVDRGKCGHCGS